MVTLMVVIFVTLELALPKKLECVCLFVTKHMFVTKHLARLKGVISIIVVERDVPKTWICVMISDA